MNRIDSPVFNPAPVRTHRARPMTRTVHRAIPVDPFAGGKDGFETAVSRPPPRSGCFYTVPISLLRPQLDTPQPPPGWFTQGPGNACGTTSLSYVLWRLGGGYVPHGRIDDAIRNLDTFSDPEALIGYARGRGMRAQLYNQGSFEALQAQLSQGRQVMVMVDPDSPQNMNTHWMAVTAVGTDAAGKRWVEYMNPATGTIHRSDWASFDAQWHDIELDGISTGYDRAYILVDRAQSAPLPPSNAGPVLPISDAANGINDLINAFGFLGQGRIFGGLGRLFGGMTSLPFTVLGTLVAALGRWAEGAGNALASTAAHLWSAGGILGKLACPFVGLASGVLKLGGWLASGIGEAASALGHGIATVAKGIGDAIDSGIHAIGDFFSGLF